MLGAAYMVGRGEKDLVALINEAKQSGQPIEAVDQIFGGTRLDENGIDKVARGRFAHCTFANVSFKGVTLENINFEDCVFLSCYFRYAVWTNCRFQSCRFIDSHIRGVTLAPAHDDVEGNKFFYCRFSDCFISYGKIESSLEKQPPNLRRELAHNLGTEALKLGFQNEARKFRWCELKAREEELKGIFQIWHWTDYDKSRYNFLDWFRASTQLTTNRINWYLWGYGEKGWVLFRNLAIITLGVFPLLFYLLRDAFHKRDGSPIGFSDFVYFSVQRLLEPRIPSGVSASQSSWALWFAGFEGFLGLIAAGLLVSYLFQWILRRQ